MFFEKQNKNFAALLGNIKTPAASIKIQQPEFKPDEVSMEAADFCMVDQPFHESQLIIALSGLKGQSYDLVCILKYKLSCGTIISKHRSPFS